MKRILAFCLAALLWAGVAPWAAAPQEAASQEAASQEAASRPVNPLPTSRLLLEDAAPIAAFDLDRSLTELCRAGRFRQQREHLFIVRLGGFVHGAVIGGAWGLYDPEGLAVPNLVYALRWQDTGRCEVRVVRHLPG
jgi:hypothetical protein